MSYSVTKININSDYLNIILIIFSYAIALFAPLELILISYAFIGPAHYLTEISWLHDKRYFTQHNYDCAILYILTFLIFLLPKLSMILLILTVCYACIAIINSIYNNWWLKGFILIIYSLVVLAYAQLGAVNMFLLFLPTLIHVFCFTLLFMLAGALKNNSIPGFLSVFILLLCPISFFILDRNNIIIPHYKSSYALHNIHYLDNIILTFTDTLLNNNIMYDKYNIIRFISFAYCYHYLNWFAKTKVIKWNDISLNRKIVITLLYIFSVCVYYYDYRLGFALLLYLSFLHVILELPLNFLTLQRIVGIITPRFR